MKEAQLAWTSCLGGRHQRAVGVGHWLDVWMWHGIELVEVELVVGTDVDVSTLVLGGITVSWSRED